MVIIADDGIDFFRRSLNSDGFGNVKSGHRVEDLSRRISEKGITFYKHF
jgi:hypothetical protein